MTRFAPFVALLLILLAALLQGCATSPSGDAFQPEIVEPSRAVMYIYREPGFGGRPVRVFINQELAGELNRGQYLARTVEPGNYIIRVEADSSMAREIRVRAGDAAYVRILGNHKPTIDEPETEVARRGIARTVRLAD